jgi:PhoH-like ATPase
MKKNYILDTNVLLHDPNAIFKFEDNNVIIPIAVIEEVDSFKKELSELGRNAREISRHLDSFRGHGRGLLARGVDLPGGGQIRVAFARRELPPELRNNHLNDNLILATALAVAEHQEELPAIFVTKDVNLRIRADALGLKAEDYEADQVQIEELYSGTCDLPVSAAAVDEFYAKGSLELPQNGLHPNQYVLVRDSDNAAHTALGRFDGVKKRIEPIRKIRDGIWGIRPRNKEQHYALDLLLNDEIKLVTLVGKAGTGKTLLALAAGLQKSIEEGIFHKLLVSRPIFPLGRDIGYLPGEIEDKLNPWMQPIYDNIELLMGLSKADKKEGRTYQELVDLGYLEIEPLTYIRGRSIPHQYLIVDEAQNLTPHEVKTIITRAGEATKIVLTGDPYQIDNPYVDSASNGLAYVVNKFQDEPIAGHVSLVKGERSQLAELAANLL